MSVIIGNKYHTVHECPQCKTQHTVPPELHDMALKTRNDLCPRNIYCPYGHTWVFKSQKDFDEAEQTRRERDRLKQMMAQKDDELAEAQGRIRDEQKRVSVFKGQVTRVKNRVAAGVCPCCNRTFENLARHMATKHSDFKKETA